MNKEAKKIFFYYDENYETKVKNSQLNCFLIDNHDLCIRLIFIYILLFYYYYHITLFKCYPLFKFENFASKYLANKENETKLEVSIQERNLNGREKHNHK